MGNQSSSSEEILEETRRLAEDIFKQIDRDGSNELDMDETVKWWKENYAIVNARAMFEAVDADKNGVIDFHEWMSFWKLVKQNGYSDRQIQMELKRIIDRDSWNFIA